MAEYVRYGVLGGALGAFIGVCRVVDWTEAIGDEPPAQQIRRTIGIPTLLGLIGAPLVGYVVFKSSE